MLRFSVIANVSDLIRIIL